MIVHQALADRLSRLDADVKQGEESAIDSAAFLIGLGRLSRAQFMRLYNLDNQQIRSLIFGENDNDNEELPDDINDICTILNDGIIEWDKASL